MEFNDIPDVIPDSQPIDDSKRSIDHYLNYVENFLQKSQAMVTYDEPFCQRILCYGHDSLTLRLIEFILGQKICCKFKHDVHLIRSNHLPNLIEEKQIRHLISSEDDAHHLSFLKIYYLQNYYTLMNHLMTMKKTNKRQLLPIALIIDDVTSYVHQYDDHEQEPEDPGPSLRKRFKIDEELLKLMRLCSLLVEIIKYCTSELKQNTCLIMNIDLNNFYPNDLDKQNDFILKITKRYFNYKINVDNICY